jgi:hypothetical protein
LPALSRPEELTGLLLHYASEPAALTRPQ